MKILRKSAQEILGLSRFSYKLWRHGFLRVPHASLRYIASRRPLKRLHFGVSAQLMTDSLQKSGPVFIKLGQILSTRRDLLPTEFCNELERLYSKQDKLKRKDLEKILKAKFGKTHPFQTIPKEALSVGSIGAAFAAELKDGQPVVLKVLRPGVRDAIERDMDVLRLFLRIGLWLNKDWRPYRSLLTRTLEELAKAFANETDLVQEAEALVEFGKRFKNHPQIYFPKAHLEFCSRDLLVMERIQGEPLNEWRKKEQHKSERSQLAETALREVLKQIFHEGRYHGDPHAGNILVMGDGRLAFIDLGLVGEFSSEDRARIVKAMRAFISKDPHKVVKSLLEFGELPEEFSYDAFLNDIRQAVSRHKDDVAKRMLGKETAANEALEELINELFLISDRHGIYVPSQVSILIKTLVTIEGVAKSLDPDLNILRIATPVILGALTPKWIRQLSGIFKPGT